MYPSNFSESYGIVVFQQVKELQNLGCHVKVISPKPWVPFPVKYLYRKWKAYSQIPSRIIWDGTEVYYPRFMQFPRNVCSAHSGERMYWGIRRLIDKIYKDFEFDIIHSHLALPDGFAAMLIAKKYNKPLVTTPRVTDIDNAMLRGRTCYDAVYTVLQNSTAVISPSAQIKVKLLEKINMNTDVIPWGIYTKNVFTGKSHLYQTYKEHTILLSVSQLIPTKGIDLNIRALAKLKTKYPSLHYLIIGKGESKDKLIELTHSLNIQDSVEFLEYLPHDKVMEYMSICDIFSLPSWQETLGLVYLEAMAHGKPIIGCQGQGVDGLVVNGETGFSVKPRDVDSLASTIDFLLANPVKAREIGERARKLVLENYTWEKNAQQYMKIYENLISTKR